MNSVYTFLISCVGGFFGGVIYPHIKEFFDKRDNYLKDVYECLYKIESLCMEADTRFKFNYREDYRCYEANWHVSQREKINEEIFKIIKTRFRSEVLLPSAYSSVIINCCSSMKMEYENDMAKNSFIYQGYNIYDDEDINYNVVKGCNFYVVIQRKNAKKTIKKLNYLVKKSWHNRVLNKLNSIWRAGFQLLRR